jgi:hypothetical protein
MIYCRTTPLLRKSFERDHILITTPHTAAAAAIILKAE